jgi:hypothetical protein
MMGNIINMTINKIIIQWNPLIIFVLTQSPKRQLQSKQEQREKQNKHKHKTRQLVPFRQ